VTIRRYLTGQWSSRTKASCAGKNIQIKYEANDFSSSLEIVARYQRELSLGKTGTSVHGHEPEPGDLSDKVRLVRTGQQHIFGADIRTTFNTPSSPHC